MITLAAEVSCPASPFYDVNPCLAHAFDLIEGTREKEQATAAFFWILITVFFLLNITYTCLINPSNSGIFKYLIKYLKKLDVGDSGVTSLKDNDVKYVVERKKNAEGGVVVLIIVMAIAVLVGYVVTSELDIPANVQTQRNYQLPESDILISANYLLDKIRFDVDKLGMHITDLVLIDQTLTTEFFKNTSIFVINGNYTCSGVIQDCANESLFTSGNYEHYSVDFWNVPNPIVTFCSTKPINETYITFAIRTGILPQSKSNINLPLVTFGEQTERYMAAYSKINPPAIKVGLTATTSVGRSVISRFTSDTGIQKVRVDDVSTSNFVATSGCDNPIIQFQLQTQQWQVIGIVYTGVSTIVISVFGAIGTVLGARSVMKTIIEWIARSYQNSPKKRAALDIIAYIIQAIIGIAALVGLILLIIVWIMFSGTPNMTTPVLISMIISTVVFLNAWICCMATTVLFCRRRPCCCGHTIRDNIFAEKKKRDTYEPLPDEDGEIEINK